LFGPPKKAETAAKQEAFQIASAPAWIFTYIRFQVVLIVRISTNLGWNEWHFQLFHCHGRQTVTP